MSFEKIAVLAFLASLAGAVYAGEMEHREVVIAVAADDADGEFKFKFNSDDTGFDLDDLQVGESRSITGESGETALITREEDGFSIDVNGKTIKMPHFEGDHGSRVWISGDTAEDVDVHVFKSHEGPTDGTVIISGTTIDEATRALIQSTLESAGHGGEVTFIDRESRHGGERHVKIIKKHIEKTQ